MDGNGPRACKGYGVEQEIAVNEIWNLGEAAWLQKSNNAYISVSFDATELKFRERNLGGVRSSKIQEILISEHFWDVKSKGISGEGK
jgi:hypothetical protein